MTTLDEAWEWFNDVKKTLARMQRVGDRYWDVIPWTTPPWSSDNQFRELEKDQVVRPAEHALANLDDLGVVVLFSVFEAVVRGTVLEQVNREAGGLRHPAIVRALETARDRIGEGSFFAVLESYKGIDVVKDNLIEEMNQVRRYRNWVAHGKRTTMPPSVAPNVAYDRLTRFLATFFPQPILTDDWIQLLRDVGD